MSELTNDSVLAPHLAKVLLIVAIFIDEDGLYKNHTS